MTLKSKAVVKNTPKNEILCGRDEKKDYSFNVPNPLEVDLRCRTLPPVGEPFRPVRLVPVTELTKNPGETPPDASPQVLNATRTNFLHRSTYTTTLRSEWSRAQSVVKKSRQEI